MRVEDLQPAHQEQRERDDVNPMRDAYEERVTLIEVAAHRPRHCARSYSPCASLQDPGIVLNDRPSAVVPAYALRRWGTEGKVSSVTTTSAKDSIVADSAGRFAVGRLQQGFAAAVCGFLEELDDTTVIMLVNQVADNEDEK